MNQKNFLVIDDDPHLGLVVEISLAVSRPWQVTLASSGEEGLRLAQSGQYHAILLDLLMPGMDGLAVLKALRQNSRTASIPVIILSAVMPFDRENRTKLPIVGLIPKPFDPVTLPNLVSGILRW